MFFSTTSHDRGVEVVPEGATPLWVVAVFPPFSVAFADAVKRLAGFCVKGA